MVFNDKILYLHIGKTGGMSISNFLCKNLDGKVYNVSPNITEKERKSNAINIKGRRHATISEAELFLKNNFDRSIDDFEYIVAGIRNPYDMEISLFSHLRKQYKLDKLKNKVQISAIKDNSFELFLEKNLYHRLGVKFEDYLLLNGSLPSQLRFIRFETMSQDLERLFGDLNVPINYPLEHVNKSKRSFNVASLTSEQREIIQKKYNWIVTIQHI